MRWRLSLDSTSKLTMSAPFSDLPLFAWKPPRKVFLFPSIRRRRAILTVARAAARAKNPDKTVAAFLARIRTSHERKRIPADISDADLRSLEAAIRAHVAQLSWHGDQSA